jgi:hypothetical protein
VLFSGSAADGLRDGTITVTFRTWKRPQVRAGGVYRPLGIPIRVDAVARVPAGSIADADARAAGAADLPALLRRLGDPPADAEVWRVDFHRVDDPDPRVALREQADLGAGAIAEIDRRLARLDEVSPGGPWTQATLAAIAARPGVVSTVLAAELGRDRQAFKVDVRKLKALGLTVSLDVGYRLSARGEAYLAATGR